MSNDFPLYPELSEEGKEEAAKLVESFKKQLLKAASEVLGQLHCEVVAYIETDSWTNFRNEIMDGFKNYDNRKIQAAYDFKEIRQAIFKEYREDIIKDLNQDLLEEIENLKRQIKFFQEMRSH